MATALNAAGMVNATVARFIHTVLQVVTQGWDALCLDCVVYWNLYGMDIEAALR